MAKEILEVPAQLEWEFEELVQDQYIVSINFGPLNDLLLLVRPQIQLDKHGVRQQFDSKAVQFSLYHFMRDGFISLELPINDEDFIISQPLPNGCYACATWRTAKHKLNFYIFDSSGQQLHVWDVGVGINDVQTSRDGQIWVSYYDEGVLSGSGPSVSGLNCYNIEGDLLFDYREIIPSSGLNSIFDCYALNVTSNQETWLCYSKGFPLVCLNERKLRQSWPTSEAMKGCKAFAVFKEQLLFVGGYEFKNRVFQQKLGDAEFTEVMPIDSEGAPLKYAWTFGRGAKLYFLAHNKIWSLSLRDF